MDDRRKQELEHLAGGLVRGEAGALEAAGRLTEPEREYVSAAMRQGTAADALGAPDPVGTLEAAAPAPEPDYDFSAWLDYGRRRGYFRDGFESAAAPSSASEPAPGAAEPDATGAE